MEDANKSDKNKIIQQAAALTRKAFLVTGNARYEERKALCTRALDLLGTQLKQEDGVTIDPDIALHILNTLWINNSLPTADSFAQVLARDNPSDVMLKILTTIEYRTEIEFNQDALWGVIQTTSREDFSKAMMRIGCQLHDVGEYGKARTILTTLAPFDRKNPELFFRIAQIDLYMGRNDSAEDYALQAKYLAKGEVPMTTGINRLLHDIHLKIVKYDPDHPDESLDGDDGHHPFDPAP